MNRQNMVLAENDKKKSGKKKVLSSKPLTA